MRNIRIRSVFARLIRHRRRRSIHPRDIVIVTRACSGVPRSFVRASNAYSHIYRGLCPNRVWAKYLVETVTDHPGMDRHEQQPSDQ